MDEPGGCSAPPTPPHPPPEGLRPAPLRVAPPTSGQPPPSKLRIVEKFASGGSGGGARLVPFLHCAWCLSGGAAAFGPHQGFSTAAAAPAEFEPLEWPAPELESQPDMITNIW